eukprot:scaffold46817_cov54-Attheya_sp.AAC.1
MAHFTPVVKAPFLTIYENTMQPHARASEVVEGVVKERVSCVYRHMHDRRIYQRDAVTAERLKEVGRGYSGGDSGGDGDFLATRLLVYKGEEGRLSATGWTIV